MKKPLFITAIFLLLTLTSAAQAQEWTPVTPGGDAVCARGTPYTFFVRGGDPNKLLIFFEGGGACWNDATCAPNSGLFDEIVEGGEAGAYSGGIFSASPDNPLAGYTVIFIAYCTGDYHLGTKAVDYATGHVEHKGYVDATAALNWTFANYKRPTNVVVAGCSAGAIGSIYYAPTVARRYNGARVTQFGDAGVGVINPAWGGFDVWGVRNRRATPDQYVASLYSSAARSYPRAEFGQYTSYNDGTQTGYYEMMGAVEAWPLAMDRSLSGLQNRANFSSFVAPGGEHCITPTDRFFSETVEGVRFRDWFAALVDGQQVADVHCSAC